MRADPGGGQRPRALAHGGPEPSRGNGLPLVETLCAAVEVVTDAEGTRLTLLSEPVARGDRP
ncbi:hypothetical protein ACFQ34_14570 [Pseudonocardia benzenivorans]|uniref:Histidine kinase-like protein n=1 Tax=Pseudonocardia benzenivorans TaxID=228005 RepID=A0ABW3VGV5_9PSEU